MANLTDLWKKGTTVPSVDSLVEGGLAIDVAGKKAYSKGSDGAIFEIGSSVELDTHIADMNNPHNVKHKFKNRIINGGMAISQSSNKGVYTGSGMFVDLMTHEGGSYRLYSGMEEGHHYLHMRMEEANTADDAGGFIYTHIEKQNIKDLYGKEVTISFSIGSNFSGILSLALGLGRELSATQYVTDFEVIADEITSVSRTLILPADLGDGILNNGWGLQISIGYNVKDSDKPDKVTNILNEWHTTTTAKYQSAFTTEWSRVAGNFLSIAGFQLEEGNIATSFDRIPLDIEETRCQRYLQLLEVDCPNTYATASHADMSAGTHAFPTRMRIPPTITPISNGPERYFGCTFKDVGTVGVDSLYLRVDKDETDGVFSVWGPVFLMYSYSW